MNITTFVSLTLTTVHHLATRPSPLRPRDDKREFTGLPKISTSGGTRGNVSACAVPGESILPFFFSLFFFLFLGRVSFSFSVINHADLANTR